MKKLVSILLAMLMVLSLMSFASADDPVVIKLMMTQSQEPGVSAAVAAFNEAYAGKIVCDAEYLAFDNVFETLEMVMGSKSTEYDVFAADGPNIAAYVNRGYLTSLNDYFTAEEIAQFTPPMQDECNYQGNFSGAAMGDSSMVMYYNKDLLKEAGVDYEALFGAVDGEHRITWEQLVEIAKDVQAKIDPDGSRNIVGIEFQQVGRTYNMNVLANDFGGVNIGDDGFTVDGVFNSEPWIKAMTWYQTQVNDGVFSRGITANESCSYFIAGKIVFYLGTTAMPGNFERGGLTTDNWGFTYKPCFEGYEENVTTCCGSWTVGLNPYSEKKEAAVTFLKYLCTGEGSDVYIGVSGMVPALSRQFTDELIAAKPYLAVAQYESANTALVRAKTPGFNEYSTAVNAMWENVRNGMDPAEAAQACIDELETAFLEYQ